MFLGGLLMIGSQLMDKCHQVERSEIEIERLSIRAPVRDVEL